MFVSDSDAVHHGDAPGLFTAVQLDSGQLRTDPSPDSQHALSETHPQRETHSGHRGHLRASLAAVSYRQRAPGQCVCV